MVKYYRKERKMSQEELSHGIISVSYLSKIENNKMEPDYEILKLLAERLVVNPNVFVIETKEELLSKLFEFYNKIVKRDFEQVNTEFTLLMQQFEGSIIPIPQNLHFSYQVVKLRYLLFKKEEKETRELFEVVNKIPPSGNERMEYIKFKTIALYYQLRNSALKANEYYVSALEILKNGTISVIVEDKAELYYQLALVKGNLCDIYESIYFCNKALKLYQSLYYLKRSAECHIILGANNNRIKQYHLAEEAYESALAVSKILNDDTLESIILQNIGSLKSDLHDSESAIKYYLASFKKKKENKRSLTTVYSLVLEYFKNGRFTESLEWSKKGIQLAELHNSKEYKIHFFIYQDLITKNPELTQYIKEEAIPFFYSINREDYVSKYTELLAELHYDNKKYKLASTYYKESLAVLKKISFHI